MFRPVGGVYPAKYCLVRFLLSGKREMMMLKRVKAGRRINGGEAGGVSRPDDAEPCYMVVPAGPVHV
jgi:hypothetical protein